MKALLIFCLIFGLFQLNTTQDLPAEFPDLDPIVVAACVAEGVSNIPYESYETQIVVHWLIDLWETVDRLIEQRLRCLEINSNALQQACLATWTATALFEANRIRRDLAVLTDEETARLFEEHFLGCFQVNPEQFKFAKLI